jgi:hypothetical protein
MLLLDGQKCIGFQSKINRRVLAQAISGGLQLAANSCSVASDNYNSFSGVSYFSRLFWVKSARFFLWFFVLVFCFRWRRQLPLCGVVPYGSLLGDSPRQIPG